MAEPPDLKQQCQRRQRRRNRRVPACLETEVVEHLLEQSTGSAALWPNFRVDETECTVTFKGPGYAANTFIDRQTGHYQLSQTYHGLIAVLNDLRQGRDTGAVWSAVIDLSACLLIVSSLSGLILLLYIKRRRIPGLVTGLVGAVVVAGGLLDLGPLNEWPPRTLSRHHHSYPSPTSDIVSIAH